MFSSTILETITLEFQLAFSTQITMITKDSNIKDQT